ncbi:hypothetical protein FB451DRAFT_283014 [Mycena latifolia]|nr:hypothetical protein FB451DRAFT_283014 [Mycena latifolia]
MRAPNSERGTSPIAPPPVCHHPLPSPCAYMYNAAAAPILAPLLSPVVRLLVRVSTLIPSHLYCHPAARHSSLSCPASLGSCCIEFRAWALGAWLSRAHCPPLLVAHAHAHPHRGVPFIYPSDDFRAEDFEACPINCVGVSGPSGPFLELLSIFPVY